MSGLRTHHWKRTWDSEPGIVCLTESDGQPWGRIRSLEEPDALIALVRICGGRRLTFGPGGPIPEAVVTEVVEIQ